MGELRVLLVEDNPDEEFLTVRVLKKFPALTRVEVARDGVEALDYITKLGEGCSLQLVLLDLKLPKVDGVDVLRRLRASDETRSVPVVILSSSDHDRDISRCMELGADYYLTKPLDPKELSAVLERLGIIHPSS
jgi:CheY-like chemotaxis protein